MSIGEHSVVEQCYGRTLYKHKPCLLLYLHFVVVTICNNRSIFMYNCGSEVHGNCLNIRLWMIITFKIFGNIDAIMTCLYEVIFCVWK